MALCIAKGGMFDKQIILDGVCVSKCGIALFSIHDPIVHACVNYEVERQRHNKQVNYTKDSFFPFSILILFSYRSLMQRMQCVISCHLLLERTTVSDRGY